MIGHNALSVELIKSTGEEAIVSSQYTIFFPKVENKWVIYFFYRIRQVDNHVLWQCSIMCFKTSGLASRCFLLCSIVKWLICRIVFKKFCSWPCEMFHGIVLWEWTSKTVHVLVLFEKSHYYGLSIISLVFWPSGFAR